MQFAFKGDLIEQARPSSINVVTIGVGYTTPDGLRPTIGDLSRLSYINAELVYDIALSQQATIGELRVRVYAGQAVVAEKQINATGLENIVGTVPVYTRDILGADKLKVEIDVVSPLDAGTTASYVGFFRVESPIVLGA